MTRILFALSVFSLLTATAAFAAESPKQEQPPVCAADGESGESALNLHAYRVGRGLANLVTCFLEVPRCVLLRNGEVPFWGAVSGAFEGVGCTGMRAFAGLIDVLFLGYDPGAVYHGVFRDFVWESPWLPPREESL